MKNVIPKSSARPVMLILVVGLLIGFISLLNRFEDPVYPSSRVIRYGFTIHNPTSSLMKDAGFWVFAPYSQTSTQKRLQLKASLPYEISHDAYGNDKMNFTFDLPPHGSKEVWIESTLAITDVPNRFPDDSAVMNKGRVTFIESRAQEILDQAQKLSQGEDDKSIRAIYDWVRQNITYSGYIKDDRGALYALKTGKGDCTEYAYLTAALGQAQHQTVRVMAGYVMPRNGVLAPEDYHNWTEFRLDHAWRLVDAQKEVLFTEPSRYIAMRVVGDLNSDNQDSSQRFYKGIGSVKVTMKSLYQPV